LRKRCSLILIVLVSTALLYAAETPIPPSPTGWVTDTANFMSPEALRSLDARLSAYEKGTGHQLIVYIAATSGDAPIEDWAVRAFKAWKVGRKGLDDGLALFIMSKDRKVRIEVGYGLEGVVPDAIASRVINEVIVPRIQGGDPDGAVTAGIDALTSVIGGQAGPLPGARTPKQTKSLSVFQWILYGIGGILLLIFFITNPSLAFFFLVTILSGGNRQGAGGGGGFGGGGGRSGGGGASGSW
jgi:uncharacterized protein